MVDQFGRWYPDYPGQQPYTDPAYIRQQSAQMQAQMQQPTPVQAPVPPVAPTVTPTQPKIWVKSDRDALEYHVPANGAADLWNDNAPYVYLKTADASGRQNTRKYRLTEEPIGENPGVSDAAQPQGVDYTSFAAKRDVAAIAGVVNSLTKDMDALRDEVANLASQAVKRATGAKTKKETENE